MYYLATTIQFYQVFKEKINNYKQIGRLEHEICYA